MKKYFIRNVIPLINASVIMISFDLVQSSFASMVRATMLCGQVPSVRSKKQSPQSTEISLPIFTS